MKTLIGGFRCLGIEEIKGVEDGEKNAGKNQLVTHLIGFIYLSGSPSSILYIVLLHLGTDFRAGSDVTCRLKEKNRKRKKKQRREQRKECSYIKTW